MIYLWRYIVYLGSILHGVNPHVVSVKPGPYWSACCVMLSNPCSARLLRQPVRIPTATLLQVHRHQTVLLVLVHTHLEPLILYTLTTCNQRPYIRRQCTPIHCLWLWCLTVHPLSQLLARWSCSQPQADSNDCWLQLYLVAGISGVKISITGLVLSASSL